MKSRRVLVTGASGFTGSHLCRRLAAESWSVRGLVRDTSKGSDLARLGVELVVGDLRDPSSLDRAVEGVGTVYHIAALFRTERKSREEMRETNVRGTQNILEASLKGGVDRFVHCSSVGVLGDVKHPPADETSGYKPGDYYQESKKEGEEVALNYMKAGEIPLVVFRPAGIYGPRDTRFLKLFKAVKRGRFMMLGSGRVLYQMIYIDDLVDGILLCGTREEAPGNIYILTGETPVILNDLVRMVSEAVGKPYRLLHFPFAPVYAASFLVEMVCKPLNIRPPIYRRRVDFFRKNRAFSINKAKRELGFQPKVDLRTGLRKTAEWYVSEGLL